MKLQGVFRNIDFNSESALGRTKERNTRAKHLLDDFNHPRLDIRLSRIGNQDVIGDAYEYLISRFAAGAGKKAGGVLYPAQSSNRWPSWSHPSPATASVTDLWFSGLAPQCAKEVGSHDFSLYGQARNGSPGR